VLIDVPRGAEQHPAALIVELSPDDQTCRSREGIELGIVDDRRFETLNPRPLAQSILDRGCEAAVIERLHVEETHTDFTNFA
jgi:hypothetical protein